MSFLSNPALARGRFSKVEGTGQMSVVGTAIRALILLALVTATAGYTWWQLAPAPDASGPYILGGLLGGLVLGLVTVSKPALAPWTAPLYAVAEGLALGALSMLMNMSYPGLPVQAVMVTFAVALAMFGLYAFRVIRVTAAFRSVVVGAMGGILLFYLAQIVLGFFGIAIPGVNGSGPIGIGVSVVTAGVAALALLLDFDRIERGAEGGTPKVMEWYGAFGLIVTLVWLYVEILDLLRKLRG